MTALLRFTIRTQPVAIRIMICNCMPLTDSHRRSRYRRGVGCTRYAVQTPTTAHECMHTQSFHHAWCRAALQGPRVPPTPGLYSRNRAHAAWTWRRSCWCVGGSAADSVSACTSVTVSFSASSGNSIIEGSDEKPAVDDLRGDPGIDQFFGTCSSSNSIALLLH